MVLLAVAVYYLFPADAFPSLLLAFCCSTPPHLPYSLGQLSLMINVSGHDATFSAGLFVRIAFPLTAYYKKSRLFLQDGYIGLWTGRNDGMYGRTTDRIYLRMRVAK